MFKDPSEITLDKLDEIEELRNFIKESQWFDGSAIKNFTLTVYEDFECNEIKFIKGTNVHFNI